LFASSTFYYLHSQHKPIIITVLFGREILYAKFEEKQMLSEKKSAVAVVMGSDSDMDVMQSCIEQLGEFGIKPTVRVISAHRAPQIAAEFAQNAAKDGTKVIIAAAGMAAHLAGALASRTTLPVIGVPLISDSGLEGIDAFLSTVQMPPGVPVATVAVGKAGAKNAAILAVQILALSDKGLTKKLVEFRKTQEKKVIEKDSALRKNQ
jgi:phosphoribosylaminoimidazole carboxylase PurE protein